MQFQSFSLKTNASMHLYNTPRDTMAKDPMLQSLFSTSIWNAPGLMPNISNYYNSCAPELMLNKIFHNSCVPYIALNTKSHHLCSSGFIPNTLCNSIMHSIFCTFHHNNHLIICIKVNHIIHQYFVL